MDQHRPPPIPQHYGLSERLAMLETAIGYERQINHHQFSEVSHRLGALEQTSGQMQASNQVTARIDAAGLIKLLAAILLPLLVFAATGSPERAARVSGAIGGNLGMPQ